MIQDARTRLYGLHWQLRSRFAKFDLWEGLSLLQESERWPATRLTELREEKLRALVARMYDASPHYRRMMDERGVKPSDINTLGDISKLPIMTKKVLREQADELRTRDIPDNELEVGNTGGTTGVPMRVLRDYAGTTWMRASYWRGFGWGGLSLGMPWVQLFGGSLGQGAARPFNKLKNWFSGKLFLPAFELSEKNVGAYVEEIRRVGARFLVGYTSACYNLAALVERAGLELRLGAVFPTAELLPVHWGERMARVFGAKVLPYYGCGEVQSLGYSCPDVPGVYHTCDEHAVIEVERADGKTSLEGEGAFLITDLDNRAMPLIRYRNGDAGALGGPGCACGRSLGRIVRLDGRVNDMLITTAGTAISGAIGAHAFRLIGGVDEYQIVQRRPGQATIKIVRARAYDPEKEEPRLRAIFGSHLGAGSEIEIEYHTNLPRTPAGKSRFVINEYLAAQAAAQAQAGTPADAATAEPAATPEAMAKKPTIVYFGNDWAAENRTSSHHVARWLAKRYKVVYVESPGLRAPKGTGRDMRKLLTKVQLGLRGPRATPEGLSVQTLLQIPFHGSALVRKANAQLIVLTLKLLMRRLGVKRPVTWFVVPHLAGVVGKLGERMSVYYCIDDYASLPDVDVEAVRLMDDTLTRNADLVFVASGTLLEGKRQLNPNTFVSPHGVDYPHFVSAQDPALPVPEDIATLKRPIVGFFGLIERWIELDLVKYLAEQRPDWSFLMIGRVAVPDSEVPKLPNLHFIGRRPYETLPAYGKAFTAAIIPYHLTPQVINSNPIKLREYLAMGKPIVSVSTPEIDKFADFVAIARTKEEYLAKLDAAVAHGLTAEQIQRQTALAATMTWDANLRKVIAIVEEQLDKKD